MEDVFVQNARSYASRKNSQVADRLGFGVHGIIFMLEGNEKGGKTAIKVHWSAEPYFREREIYQRLMAAEVTEILGFHVPQMIAFDDKLLIIEMTIVTRPFVLDFAGAYMDARPNFPEEAWAQWEAEKRDQFDSRWPTVQAILEELENLDIFLVDVSPSNVAFLNAPAAEAERGPD